jgi:hypothetical protein
MCIILITIKIYARTKAYDLNSISAILAEACAVFAPEEGDP